MLDDDDKPLITATHAIDRFGQRIRVRPRNADVTWNSTAAGKAYFNFNRTEYLPNKPALVLYTQSAELVDGE